MMQPTARNTMGRSDRVPHRIPEFRTLEEEAQFWDAHSLSEFQEEIEPVTIEVADPIEIGLRVSLPRATFHRLLDTARRRGVSPGILAGEVIAKGLEHTESTGSTAAAGRRATAD
jgi:CopG antitoxin of type II toxin-antitoxin system